MVRTFLPQISLLVLVAVIAVDYANSVPDFRGNLPAVCKRQLCRNDCSDHRNLFRSRYQPAFYRRRHHHVLLLQRTGNYHRRNEQDVLYPVPVICRKCVCKCIDVWRWAYSALGDYSKNKNRRWKISPPTAVSFIPRHQPVFYSICAINF